MVRRSVYGIYLERDASAVCYIVPGSGGDEAGVAAVCPLTVAHGTFRRAEAYCRAALHDADELICVLVDLRADVAVCGYAHQRYLQMLARPCLFSEICVLFRLAVNVHDCRLSAAAAAVLIVVHLAPPKFFLYILCAEVHLRYCFS